MVIDQLFIYPIKSLPPVEVQKVNGYPHYLDGDRAFVLLDEDDNMLTLRHHERLALFNYRSDGSQYTVHSNILNQSIGLNFDPINTVTKSLNIWDMKHTGQLMPAQYNDFFSEHLNLKVQLIRKIPDTTAPAFHDACPLLIANSETISYLEKETKSSIDIMRFRPNIITRAAKHLEELAWTQVAINHQKFNRIKPCSRCVMINRNPKTGTLDRNILKELGPYLIKDKKFRFGLYIGSDTPYTLSVGDKIATTTL